MYSEREIILYQSENSTQIEVRIEDEAVWLSLSQMSNMFERDKSVISRHIRNIFEESELEKKAISIICKLLFQTNLQFFTVLM